MRPHVHALIHCDFRETSFCFCMSNLFLTFPAHHSKKYSQVKHFSSKQSLQPHESTSAISYEPEEVYTIPKRKARVHTRRKAKHLPQQEFPNPKSVPQHNSHYSAIHHHCNITLDLLEPYIISVCLVSLLQ